LPAWKILIIMNEFPDCFTLYDAQGGWVLKNPKFGIIFRKDHLFFYWGPPPSGHKKYNLVDKTDDNYTIKSEDGNIISFTISPNDDCLDISNAAGSDIIKGIPCTALNGNNWRWI